ncbi:MAG: hypothetical protein ACXV5N_11770 [Halobacteriota archaeon]
MAICQKKMDLKPQPNSKKDYGVLLIGTSNEGTASDAFAHYSRQQVKFDSHRTWLSNMLVG